MTYSRLLPFLFSIALLLVISGPSLLSQTRSEVCNTDSLVISTGWDRLDDTVEVFDKKDSWWRVERIAAGSTHQLFLPEHAPIIPFAHLIPIDGCRWIGDVRSYSDSVSVNYRFTTEFCLTNIVEIARLECKLLSSGRIRMLLNNVELHDASLEELADRYDPLYINQDITTYVRPGKNILHVEISEATGRNAIALSGSITARSTEDPTPFSCDECGQILPERNERR